MIRTATKKDLQKSSDLIRYVLEQINSNFYSSQIIDAWKNYMNAQNLEKELEKGVTILVYEHQKEIIGIGALDESHIERVYIHPDFQRKGIGKQIVNKLEEIAKSKGNKIIDLNSTKNALDFYLSLGYHIDKPIALSENEISVSFTRMIKQI